MLLKMRSQSKSSNLLTTVIEKKI